MKKYTLLTATLFTAFVSQAQITITATDFAAIGDHIVQYTDTATISDPGAAGANVTWNFSAAQKQQQIAIDAVTVNSTGFENDFPTATLAMTEDGGQSYAFFSISNTTYESLGFGANAPGIEPMIYDPALPEYTFPLEFNDASSSSYSSTITMDASDMGMYRLIIRHHGTFEKQVDGWGTLITPTATYPALRVKVTENAVDSTFMQMTEDSEPQFMGESSGTVVTYAWLAKNGKLPVAEFDNGYFRFLESTSHAAVDEHSTAQAPIAYPNPSQAGQGFRFSGLDDATYTLYLYDVNGKCLYGKKGQGTNLTVETEGLATGIYHYVLAHEAQAKPHTGSVLIK